MYEKNWICLKTHNERGMERLEVNKKKKLNCVYCYVCVQPFAVCTVHNVVLSCSIQLFNCFSFSSTTCKRSNILFLCKIHTHG